MLEPCALLVVRVDFFEVPIGGSGGRGNILFPFFYIACWCDLWEKTILLGTHYSCPNRWKHSTFLIAASARGPCGLEYFVLCFVNNADNVLMLSNEELLYTNTSNHSTLLKEFNRNRNRLIKMIIFYLFLFFLIIYYLY